MNELSVTDPGLIAGESADSMGLPISGSKKTTCSSTPNTIMKPSVIKNPQKKGTWNSVRIHQQTHAPISRNSPWAKFTICEAL